MSRSSAKGGQSILEVLRPARLEQIRPATSVVMVGGMCAGKSTLAHAAALMPRPRFQVVRRVSTREPRAIDAADGVSQASWEEYEDLIDANAFALSWRRPLSDGSSIGYGCLAPSAGNVPIFMAGHGIYTNVDTVRPMGVLDRSLVVGVLAAPNERMARLELRSPEIKKLGEQRLGALLAHDDAMMFRYVDVAVQNHDGSRILAVDHFVKWLGAFFGDG